MKIGRLAIAAARAEQQIDAHYVFLLAKEEGPLSQLHLMKRLLAVSDVDSVLVPDKEAVLQRAGEQDLRIAEINTERRALKAAVRAAGTSAEIAAIVAHLSVTA